MGSPTVNDPASFQTTALDGEAISLASDFTPTVAGRVIREIWVGVSGNIKVDFLGFGGTAGGTAVVHQNVPVGPFQGAFTKVYSTANGTTASALVAHY